MITLLLCAVSALAAIEVVRLARWALPKAARLHHSSKLPEYAAASRQRQQAQVLDLGVTVKRRLFHQARQQPATSLDREPVHLLRRDDCDAADWDEDWRDPWDVA